ncbi:MAG TPA: outer membrane lipoprotein carrier protein LolA [Pyrinomonadaceae bacterium]|jgi:outer membrane lipoprotein-sorting protein
MKMPVRFYLAVLSLALLLIASATTATSAQAVTEILKRMQVHNNALLTLHSNITMSRRNSQLDENDVLQGNIIYSRALKKQKQVKIDWTKPYEETLHFTDGRYVIYRPRLRQMIAGDIEKTDFGTETCNLLPFLRMSKAEIKANYAVAYLGAEIIKGGIKTWRLSLQPKQPAGFKSIDLWIDKDGMPRQAKALERNGDSTTVLFSELTKNGRIDGKLFQPAFPKNVNVLKASGTPTTCKTVSVSAAESRKAKRKSRPVRKVKTRKKRRF